MAGLVYHTSLRTLVCHAKRQAYPSGKLMLRRTECPLRKGDRVDVLKVTPIFQLRTSASYLIMTRDQLSDVSITTPAEFEAVLAEAIERAIHAEIDVRGAWAFQTRGSTHNWEVQIVELDAEFDDENQSC